MEIPFTVVLDVDTEYDYLELADPLPADLVEELRREVLVELDGSIAGLPGIVVTLARVEPPVGYSSPAPHTAPVEPTWDDLPTRLVAILRDNERYPDPRAAYNSGEAWLTSAVQGFGARSWQTLAALFEG